MRKRRSARSETDEREAALDCDYPPARRGSHAPGPAAGYRLVVLEPDVARYFGSSDRVNRALRALSEIARRQVPKAPK